MAITSAYNFTTLGDFLDAQCRTTVDLTIGTDGLIPCAEVNNGANKTGRPIYDRPHNFKFNAAYLAPDRPGQPDRWRAHRVHLEAPLRASADGQRAASGTTTNSGQTATYFYEERGDFQLDGPARTTSTSSTEADVAHWQHASGGRSSRKSSTWPTTRRRSSTTTSRGAARQRRRACATAVDQLRQGQRARLVPRAAALPLLADLPLLRPRALRRAARPPRIARGPAILASCGREGRRPSPTRSRPERSCVPAFLSLGTKRRQPVSDAGHVPRREGESAIPAAERSLPYNRRRQAHSILATHDSQIRTEALAASRSATPSVTRESNSCSSPVSTNTSRVSTNTRSISGRVCSFSIAITIGPAPTSSARGAPKPSSSARPRPSFNRASRLSSRATSQSARRLIADALDRGASREDAQGLLDRIDRLGAGQTAPPRRRRRRTDRAPRTPRRLRAPRSARRRGWVAAVLLIAAAIGVVAVGFLGLTPLDPAGLVRLTTAAPPTGAAVSVADARCAAGSCGERSGSRARPSARRHRPPARCHRAARPHSGRRSAARGSHGASHAAFSGSCSPWPPPNSPDARRPRQVVRPNEVSKVRLPRLRDERPLP